MGSLIMEKNLKRSLFKHSGVLSDARPQSQLPFGIMPVDVDGRKCTVFIIILVALILVKLKGSILTGVYMQFNGRFGLIIYVLADGAHRQNGSGAHIERQPADGASAWIVWPPEYLCPVQKSYHSAPAGR